MTLVPCETYTYDIPWRKYYVWHNATEPAYDIPMWHYYVWHNDLYMYLTFCQYGSRLGQGTIPMYYGSGGTRNMVYGLCIFNPKFWGYFRIIIYYFLSRQFCAVFGIWIEGFLGVLFFCITSYLFIWKL